MKSIQYEENLDGRTADTRWRYNIALPQMIQKTNTERTQRILVDTEPITKTTR